MLGTAGGRFVKHWGAWLLALLLFLPLPCRAELTAQQRSEADAYFQRAFSRAKAIGGAVIVSRDGERIYEFFYGANDKKGSRPVDEETVYKVASVTKLVTAIGVMRLAEAGRLDLDAGMVDSFGRPVRNPRYPDQPVTLRQAMSHTSSLLGGAPYTAVPPWAEIGVKDTKYFSNYAPGTHYEYSNLNGGLLGTAIERAAGVSLNTYMRERVFAPLGINAAYAAHLLPDPSVLSHTYAADRTVYMKAEKYIQEDAASYDDTCDPDAHCRTAVGGLYISLSGLEKLAGVLACGGEYGGVRLLSEDAALQMRADQAALPGSSVTGSSPYGLCMYRFTGEDNVVWWGHQGRWKGLLTDVFIQPETRAAVVFVMNGVGRGGTAEVDAKAARTLQYVDAWLFPTEE